MCHAKQAKSSGGKDTQKLFRQVLKLYTVGGVVHEQMLPAQDRQCKLDIQYLSPQKIWRNRYV